MSNPSKLALTDERCLSFFWVEVLFKTMLSSSLVWPLRPRPDEPDVLHAYVVY